jgi:hypothetical protein
MKPDAIPQEIVRTEARTVLKALVRLLLGVDRR